MSRLHEKATHQQTRLYNRQLVLRTIFDAGSISRAAIARLTDLTPVTVSEIVTELIAEKLVAEVAGSTSVVADPEAPARRGRPPILVKVAAGERLLLALRLAVHEFRGALLDLNGEFVYSKTVAVGDARGHDAVQLIVDLVEELVARSDRPVLGIGVASPGIVNTDEGVVLRSIFFGWQELGLAGLLHRRFGLPVHVANASQVTALAEYVFGDDRSTHNLAVVRVGQDVGAGFVIGGQLYFGDGFGAGEIGHIVVQEDGELCDCGNRGCLETLISSRALVRLAQRLAGQHPASPLARHFAGQGATLDSILAAYREGDPLAVQLAQRNAEIVGRALATVITLLNIERILLVGSVTQFGAAWLQTVRDTIPRSAIPDLARQTDVKIAQHGPDAIILGSAALLLARELGLTLRTALPHG
jgi:predicted NBD/HSP70 family sugar kinase